MLEATFDCLAVRTRFVSPHRGPRRRCGGQFATADTRQRLDLANEIAKRLVVRVSDDRNLVVPCIDLDGVRNIEHNSPRVATESNRNAERTFPFVVGNPTNSSNRKCTGPLELSKAVADCDRCSDPEVGDGRAERIVEPESAVVRGNEFPEEHGRVEFARDNVPRVLPCHNLYLMVDSRVFRWAAGSLVEEDWCDPHAGNVRVADSFLVVDGTAVAIDDHVNRFATSLAAVDSTLDVATFAHDVLALIPAEGRWFPRLEAIDYGDGALLRFHLREAPEPLTEVTLATSTHDPRTNPRTKGPDLIALGALRREFDCGEAVILDDGDVAEGAWSSIVWWADDTLHVVHPDIARLDGVTESVIRRHAAFIGAPVISANVTPAHLEGCEVWVLSALHGIRVATEWRDGPSLHVEPGRAEYWRQQYANQRRPING